MKRSRTKIGADPSGAASEELKLKNVWRSIAWLIILVIIFLSLMPDPQKVTPFSASDKLLHTLAYGVAMIWFGLCFKRDKLYPIGAGLVFMGIALEVIQGQTGYRTMSLFDIFANCAGVAVGLLFSISPFSKSLYFIERKFLK